MLYSFVNCSILTPNSSDDPEGICLDVPAANKKVLTAEMVNMGIKVPF